MRCGAVILLASLDLLIAFTLYAQPVSPKNPQLLHYNFRHIDHTDGLLKDGVYFIGQDKNGFIWINMRNHLQRYDGLRFTSYDNPPDSAAPRDQKKYQQYTDENGNSWFMRPKYAYLSDTLMRRSPNYVGVLGPNNLYYQASMTEDTGGDGTLVATYNGLCLFDKKTRKIYSHSYNPLHKNILSAVELHAMREMIQDSHGNIWFNSWSDSFFRYNSQTGRLSTYSLSSIKKARSSNNNPDASLLVNFIFEDDHGTVWLGTENAGLLKYNSDSDDFSYILNEKNNSESIQYNYDIYCIFQDKEENLWIGSDKGISIFNPYRQYFTAVRAEPGTPQSLPDREIDACIGTPAGDILIGTWGGGISVYDSRLRFKKNMLFDGNPENNLVWCFLQDDDKKIWVGCQHGYLHILDPATFKVSSIHPPELQASTVRCMAKDKEGNIWFGLHNGKISKWCKKENKFYSFNPEGQSLQPSLTPITNILIDRFQNFWVSSENGLKQFDPVARHFIQTYQEDSRDSSSISSSYCRGMEELNDSILLVGTANGINLFNKNTHRFSKVDDSGGLPFNTIYALKKDDQGYIWFTTDYGIYKFLPSSKKFIAYNLEKGVINSSFQSCLFSVTSGNRWLTSTYAEVVCFQPDSLTNRTPDEKVVITGFKVFDKPVPVDSLLLEHKPVRLPFNQNFFNIEFATLSFSKIQETKYYYQLSGVNKNWVNAGSKRFADYTDLDPGEYTFRVKSENGFNEGPVTSFTIIISPPFWETTWFIATCVLVVAFIAWWIFRKRIETIRKEADLKHKIAETEMMALRAQMNPHFIFNCLNAIDNMIQTNQKGKATTYLNRFARLIRSVLDSSKNKLVPFHKDYETLQLFLDLEQFRSNNKFEYQLSADPELLNSDVKVPPLIIQPFVENAIHHGLMNKPEDNRKLVVNIRFDKDNLKYTVIDNGIGRKKAAQLKAMNRPEHIPYGIEITKERVNLHNHNGKSPAIFITDLEENNIATGTKVELWLSVQ